MSNDFLGPVQVRSAVRYAAVIGMVLGMVLCACGRSTPDPELPESSAVAAIELGRIGGRIYNEPNRMEEILRGAGMSNEAFQRQVRTVTQDATLALEYQRGFGAVLRPRPAPPAAQPPQPGG